MCPALSSVAQTSSSLQMSKWMLAIGTQDPGAGWSSSVPVQLSNTLAQTCRRCLVMIRCSIACGANDGVGYKNITG